MQVNVEELSPVEKKLAVEIPWVEVAAKLDVAYRELGRSAALKGFRKGKVPRQILEQVYGRQVQAEVAKELVQETFMAVAREHKLEPVAEPVVEDATIRRGEVFKYSARVEVRGTVELKEWKAIPATRKPVVVLDAEIDATLEQRRQEQTEYKPVEGRTQTATTDVVVVHLTGAVGEHQLDRSVTVDLTRLDLDPLPGLAQRLTGIAVDAKGLELEWTIAEDEPQKELAGKLAKFTINVLDVREKLVPALDDDFAKDTGEADTLAELKAKVREKLEAQARTRVEREGRENVLKELIKRNPIPVAPALVERGVDVQLQRTKMSFAMQGMDLEKSGIDLGIMREKMREPALEEVRGQLLLEALADANELQVSDADLTTRLTELAAQREKPVHKLRAEMDKDGSLDSLRWRLRQEKALDLLASEAKITEAAPEPPPATPEP